MKKILLTFAAAIGLGAAANAQLALETFNHAGAFPTGWVLQSDGHIVSTAFTSLTWLQDSLDNHAWFPISKTYTGLGTSTSDYQMISTSKFATAATADRWLITPAFTVTSIYTVIQWDDNVLGSSDNLQVLVSPTASTTTSTFVPIYSAVAGASGLVTHQVLIGAYNGSSIRVAFHENTNNGWGLVVDNVQSAIIDSYNLGVTSLVIPPFIQTGSSNPITGVLHNYGAVTTTSARLSYSINGGTPVSTSLTALTLALGGDYNYTSGTPWVPSVAGNYTIKVWADNINGTGIDQTHSNDTFVASVLVVDTLQPKTVMIEEFTQASCDPCANAHVNVDTVYANNSSRACIIRNHVNWPGRDCMDSVTLAPFVSARVTYYGVSGVPDAKVDGKDYWPGAGYSNSLTTTAIGNAANYGSPFSITISPAMYNVMTRTYSATVNIKSFGAIAAGLKAYATLAVDTITYHLNQSTESISQTIFPQVSEAMLPSASGSTLTAFTSGSTQTLNLSWVKNHPWGSDFSVWQYDSSATSTIVVWVESDVTKYVYQAAKATIFTPVGIDAVKKASGSMDVYPNPANKMATVAINLTEASDIKMEIYNAVGQLVYNLPTESRNSGISLLNLNVADFAAGTYFVRVTIGEEVMTKNLTIAK